MADTTQGRRFGTAPLDQLARGMTFFIAGLVLILPAVLGLTTGRPATAIGAVGVGVVILAASWALSPAGYSLEGRTLLVHRRMWRPFATAAQGFSRHDEPQRLGWRVVGAGGLFGWFGRFRRPDLGTYRAYVTSRDDKDLVALKTTAGVLVISPADRRAFVAAVKKALR